MPGIIFSTAQGRHFREVQTHREVGTQSHGSGTDHAAGLPKPMAIPGSLKHLFLCELVKKVTVPRGVFSRTLSNRIARNIFATVLVGSIVFAAGAASAAQLTL